ncbi:pyridoxal phosphate-dependent decarboxylase family protein [Rhodohalobacter sp.]|uniref:pyridoxal phosphate-dependent decarboxylase family protein n=1 Tax=Rhodohalobacter sp. TaxID=1974210 RepID=UPI002ACD1FA1|nr:aminotransferase class I/II-fold pyridoxal phosphate-dependent enzyme [Rhodohalobacter sp.]MDZ7755756.1 aminotransferase class I/II-fold pyridoxal phosphate-dependent enzyme [Rhodohalobacter sp.]
MNLDFSPDQLSTFIKKAGEIVRDIYTDKLDRHVFPGKTPEEIQSIFNESLPENGMDVGDLLKKVQNDVIGSATMNVGPHYYGYITGGGNQVAILAEMISASLNQNNLKWHSSPVSTELEKLVIKWVSQFIGYTDQAAGAILDGGSTANLNCLAVARKNMAPDTLSSEGMYGLKPMTIYVSEEGHSSFDKAVDALGIGLNNLRKIPVDDHFKIRTDLLKEQIQKDRKAGLNPICVIGIAGTTNSGAVDDLQKLADIAKEEKMWYHVDAAYGGPAAKLESVKHLFTGLEEADSVVVNPHKWLYVPFEAACILVKDPEKLRRTFSLIPDYLQSNEDEGGRTDLMEYQLPLTKSFKSLKVWMTLKAFGAKRLRETIQADIDHAQYLQSLIEKLDDFEMLAPVPLSIACFRYTHPGLDEKQLDELNQKLAHAIEQDGRIFLTATKVKGKTALRTCFINPRTTKKDVEWIPEVIRDVASGLI